MHETLLLDKPVVYGSDGFDYAFIALVTLHALAGGGAVVAGVVALAAKKGRRVHLAWGKAFVRLMVATALSGIVVDVTRLTFFFTENHTQYAGSATPSSIPARIGFLVAAVCILYLARVARDPRDRRPRPSWERALPWAVVASALLGAGVVIARFNPWTGALWMIATFAGAAIATGRMAPGVAQHRFAMLFLAAFSWWGAFQGFGPALGRLLGDVESSTAPYTGHLPGGFSFAFFGFLVVWAPAFLAAAVMHVRFARRRLAT
ncbi:MAG: hypothetical protein H6719_27350 [Sandaracinaceae bacterium]|nr:hypothetical protein [Sandaracinaceae bacterium]